MNQKERKKSKSYKEDLIKLLYVGGTSLYGNIKFALWLNDYYQGYRESHEHYIGILGTYAFEYGVPMAVGISGTFIIAKIMKYTSSCFRSKYNPSTEETIVSNSEEISDKVLE